MLYLIPPDDASFHALRGITFRANVSMFLCVHIDEKNASGGASIFANSMRRFASNVRSTLDSVQSPPPPATSEEPKKLTKFQGQQQQY